MFKYHKKIVKNKIQTTYGSVCIENIIFEPEQIQKILPEVVLEDDNLKYMFEEDDLDMFNRRNIYRRFIPSGVLQSELADYVDKSIDNNKNFYSFLAEGILSLVYRDMYDYSLAKGVIDVRDTVNDTHTGVDACMYNRKTGIIILGEAKFYANLYGGMKTIISDFKTNNLVNKLESLKIAAQNNRDSANIIIKNLDKEDYEEISVQEFMQQKIVFAGFVLHGEKDIKKFDNKEYYDRYDIDTEQLKKNICDKLDIDNYTGECNIVLIHLPIKDKKELIVKMIEKSKVKLDKAGGY